MDKVKITLYEVSGYLIPGMITALSFIGLLIIFSENQKMFLHESGITVFLFLLISYFAGHGNQAIANIIFKNKVQKYLPQKREILNQLKSLLKIEKNSTLHDTYKCAHNFVLLKGKTVEFDTYLEREALYRGTLIGVGIMSLTIITSFFKGDIILDHSEFIYAVTFSTKIIFLVALIVLGLLFYLRYTRFMQYRIDLVIDTVKLSDNHIEKED